jgi:hypothetical protein
MLVILFGVERESVGWIFAEPFLDYDGDAGHLAKARQLPDFDGEIPESQEENKTDHHKIRPRTLDPLQHPVERQIDPLDIAVRLTGQGSPFSIYGTR